VWNKDDLMKRPNLAAGMYMLAAQQCKLCGQFILNERQKESRAAWALIRTLKYGICPVCRQEVQDGIQIKLAYRRRWDTFMREFGRKWKAVPKVNRTTKMLEQLTGELVGEQ
jgi:hypothetical protein